VNVSILYSFRKKKTERFARPGNLGAVNLAETLREYTLKRTAFPD
jgi:hypothetical protein